MHDRYFFLADVFTFILAFAVRGGWQIAFLVQLGSTFAYTKFLFGFASGPYIGAIFMSLAVIRLLWLNTERSTSTQPKAPADV
jgi:hypothetical protein